MARWVAIAAAVGLVLGVAGAKIFWSQPTALPTDVDPDAEWESYEGALERLTECGNVGEEEGETRCALRVMDEANATRDARLFFHNTHWFLTKYREMGAVDLGRVETPWRANANDDYMLLNGSPSVIIVEEEAPVLALFGQDRAYDPLRRAVNEKDDVPNEDDLTLWETDELFEGFEFDGNKPRFFFQWSLNDGCHSCETGYFARVALEFASDGTYMGAEPLSICYGRPPNFASPGMGGLRGELKKQYPPRVESRAPECPATPSLFD